MARLLFRCFDEADETTRTRPTRLLVAKRALDDPERRPGVADPKSIPGLHECPQHDFPGGFDALDVLLEAEAHFAELTSQLLQSAIRSVSAVMRG